VRHRIAQKAAADHRPAHQPSLRMRGHPARLLNVQSARYGLGNTRPRPQV
jgi:hypothetical protein